MGTPEEQPSSFDNTVSKRNMTPEEIKDKYEKRILQILSDISDCLKDGDEGWKVGEAFEQHDDEYQWAILISKSDEDPMELEDDDIDIKFTILESEHNDGEENGVSFAIDAVTIEGCTVGGLTPYNYTKDVWVARDDEEAIERRFQIMQQADVSELIYLINHHE